MTVNRTLLALLLICIIAFGFVGGYMASTSPSVAQSEQEEYTLAQVFTAWLFSVQVCRITGEVEDIGYVETERCWYEVPDWFHPIVTPVPSQPPIATPTQENTELPPITPGPTKIEDTPTPITPDETCTIVNRLSTAINIRSQPAVGDNKVGSWQPGVPLVANQFYDDGTYRWAKVGVNAWVVVWNGGVWWITSNDCSRVRDWGATWTPPPPIEEAKTLGGAHTSAPISFQTKGVIYSLPNIQVIKSITLAGDLLREIKLNRPDIITIFRVTDPECPTRDEVYNNPILYADKLRTAWAHYGPGNGFVNKYEIMNECSAFSGKEDYQALAQFFITVARYLNETEGVCILVGGFGPGNPLITDFVELYPFFRWSEEHPCGPSEYHGVSAHASVCPPFPTPNFPWNCWDWVYGRHLKYNQALLEQYNYDLLNSVIPYVLSEAGIGYGFSEDEDVFTAEQKKLALMNTLCLLSEDGVDMLVWWNLCGGDNCWGWLNDSDDIEVMFSWTQEEFDYLRATNQICIIP